MAHSGRHVSAAAALVVGTSILAVAWVYMNAKSHRSKEVRQATTVDLAVEKKKKKEPPKSKPKPRPRPRPSRARPAPRPSFGSSLGGLGGGIPVFSAGDLAGLGDDALGGADATKNLVMTSDTVDSQPKRIPELCPNPAPPNNAVRRGITGYVQVAFTVSVDGRLQSLKILKAEPPGIFDESVLGTLRQWQMQPAMYGGQAVAMTGNFTFRFAQ